MENEKELTAAKFLIVGFYKAWVMNRVFAELHTRGINWQDYDFMPTTGLWGRTPARAFIAAEYPKLFTFLDRNESSAGLKAAKEIVKLKASIRQSRGAIDEKERDDIDYANKKNKAVSQSYRASLAAFRRRKDWAVTK